MDVDVKGYKIYCKDGNDFDLLEIIDSCISGRFVDEGNFFKKLKDGIQYEY